MIHGLVARGIVSGRGIPDDPWTGGIVSCRRDTR